MTLLPAIKRWQQSCCRLSIPLLQLGVFAFLCINGTAQREAINLNENWHTIATTNDKELPADTYKAAINDTWQQVNVPHNWDQYEGYRRLLHGNRHGDAWYRKTFTISNSKTGKRFFLFFEGVGSYATVYLNNQPVGTHAGGRTTFTLDITDVIHVDGKPNQLAVRSWHPSGIKDLPWVCGGCSDERGFSEGSQPMGIFRPVQLIITNDLRISPFGIHAWAEVKNDASLLNVNTTCKNYSATKKIFTITHRVKDAKGKLIKEVSTQHTIKAGDSVSLLQNDIQIPAPTLWSVENPYLYAIETSIHQDNQRVDQTSTPFGFRTISWQDASNRFFLNGQPVFINGIAEYEHLLGQSHAFSKEQIQSRFKWIHAAGFNAFRDGHQPHNLLYGQHCDEQGILWWTQLSAHVWYDSPEFRNNFKTLLREWVIERRNSPSVVLWGLQNESKIPEDFAKECTELIRSLDPTASAQRLVTTCNGGSGTDWDVPQNWTGTYGGDPATYADDLKKQVLIGEYGAWRTIDLHTEGGFAQNGLLSEDRMVQLMEQKVRLGELAKDSSAGHFFWLLTSHDNPGRVQGGEGLRELDRIGPVNYKGMLTPWEEPADVYYMYRSNFAQKETQPMVYIVSHTWPNRWTTTGIKDSLFVYSNCDEVELFNDIENASLGRKKRNGIGTHFQWDGVNIRFNVLYAVGYVNGKPVARDTIVLNHLPKAPQFEKLFSGAVNLTLPQQGYNYLYRINCGGPTYMDENGNTWLADVGFAQSWTKDFPEIPAAFASQRRTFSPIRGTKDWPLFQPFRYGKDKLSYAFPVPDGEYLVELYFVEPWLGIGGGINATGMRLFDVAINNQKVLDDLDIWKEVGTNTALKKTVKAKAINGRLHISFPESKSGQAVISAIAIATKKSGIKPFAPPPVVKALSAGNSQMKHWLDIGQNVYANDSIQFHNLPPVLFGSSWMQLAGAYARETVNFTTIVETDLFLALRENETAPKDFENTFTQLTTDEHGGTTFFVYRKRLTAGAQVKETISRNSLLIFQPASQMQPAYDLKTIKPYRTNVAIVGPGVVKEQVGGRECTVIKTNDTATIEWPVETGVADRYAVTVKYYYTKDEPVQATLLLLDAGDRRMMEEKVQFTFTRPGKWNQFTVSTPSQINAGYYRVKLIASNGETLALSGIEIQ